MNSDVFFTSLCIFPISIHSKKFAATPHIISRITMEQNYILTLMKYDLCSDFSRHFRPTHSVIRYRKVRNSWYSRIITNKTSSSPFITSVNSILGGLCWDPRSIISRGPFIKSWKRQGCQIFTFITNVDTVLQDFFLFYSSLCFIRVN